MLSRKNLKKNIFATENTRDGVDTSRESLSEENHVGLDGGVVLEAKEFSSTSETLSCDCWVSTVHKGEKEGSYSLNFIANEKNVVFLAKGLNSLEVVLIGNNDTVKVGMKY